MKSLEITTKPTGDCRCRLLTFGWYESDKRRAEGRSGEKEKEGWVMKCAELSCLEQKGGSEEL